MQTFGKQINNPGVFTPLRKPNIPNPEGSLEGEMERAPLRVPADIRESERKDCDENRT